MKFLKTILFLLVLSLGCLFLAGFGGQHIKSLDQLTPDEQNCVKAGGTVANIEECDGSVSRICVFPEGKGACYVENVKNGVCVGIFQPKIWCGK